MTTTLKWWRAKSRAGRSTCPSVSAVRLYSWSMKGRVKVIRYRQVHCYMSNLLFHFEVKRPWISERFTMFIPKMSELSAHWRNAGPHLVLVYRSCCSISSGVSTVVSVVSACLAQPVTEWLALLYLCTFTSVDSMDDGFIYAGYCRYTLCGPLNKYRAIWYCVEWMSTR